jgi:cytochrome c-type biogenesis protein CcmH/NrfG
MTSRTLLASLLMAFVLVAGLGAAISFLRDPPGSNARPLSRSGSSGEALTRLKEYTRSAGIEEPAATAPAAKPLPDVDTMIQRLSARLEAAPGDIKGWRMLGWSYFNTERYELAAAAYGKALALDPNSAEIKLSYEEARVKASETALTVGNGDDGPRVATTTKSEATPPHDNDAAIRAMVDGLAHRLENSPRDVEGWTRLMRSRVMLGEREVAATAFRKALEVFKDDSGASGKITAAAVELGLQRE